MKRYIIMTLTVAAMTMSSCQHKDLCYEHPHTGTLDVVFDWTKAPDAEPATMELFLFPKGGGTVIHHQFGNRYGGSLTVPSGVYRSICFNTGNGANRFSDLNTPYEEFRVETRSISDDEAFSQMRSSLSISVPKSTVEDDESTILEPDILYSSHHDEEIVTSDNVRQTITFYPERRTPRYTVILKNVQNLKYTKSRMATLSSLSCSFMAGYNRSLDGSHTESFVLGKVDETTLQGALTVFGHRHDQQPKHILSVYFVLLDGHGVYYNFDITSKICTPELEGVMEATIVIDLGIEIPKPIVNGSGFHPTVDGWRNEDIDITM